jgi:hypothetical protein
MIRPTHADGDVAHRVEGSSDEMGPDIRNDLGWVDDGDILGEMQVDSGQHRRARLFA